MDNIDFFITLPSNDRSFPEDQQYPNNWRVRFPAPINLEMEYQVALYEIFYNVGENETSSVVDGLEVITTTQVNDLFVYCDLIKAQVVGSSEVRLLKHINNNQSNISQVFRASEPLQWVDVIAKHITQVRLQINDQQGNPVPMNNTTVAVLAFKKKP